MNKEVDLIIKDGEEELTDYPYLGLGSKPYKKKSLSEFELEKIIGG